MMPDNCQFASILLVIESPCWPNGIVQIGLHTSRDRTSKSDNPRIDPTRSRLFCGVEPDASDVDAVPGVSSIDLPYVYESRKERPLFRRFSSLAISAL